MSRVLIGRIGRPHGLDGETYLDNCSLSASELGEVRTFTWVNARGLERAVEVREVRPANARLLVKFTGVSSRDAVAELTNGELFVAPDQLPDAGPGVAYHFQLMGLEVRTTDGRSLGEVADIIVTGAHPVYVIRGERELLVPGIPEFVRNVDLAARVMTVSLPAGLEESMA